MTTLTERHTGTLPVTESQKGLLLLDRQLPARHLYNLLYEIDLTGTPEPAAVRDALAYAVAVQPSLRLRFDADTAVLVEPPPPAAMPFEDIALDDDALVAETLDRLGAMCFDLADGPLFHVAHLHSDTRHVLVLVVHHLVFCHFSVRPFTDDLHTALTAPPSGAEVAELRAVRERLFAAEMRVQERVARDDATLVQARELAERLDRGAPTALYPHPERPDRTRHLGTRLTWDLRGTDAAAVHATCRAAGVSTYEFFQAAFGVSVARHSGTSGTTIGNVFFTRRTAGSLGLTGFFVNTLPVAVAFDWSDTFADYVVNRLRPEVEFTRARGKVAFNQVVEVLNPERPGNRNPVFAALFAMYDEPMWPAGIASVRLHGNHTAKFDLWLGVTAVGDGWRVEVEYDRDLFPAAVGEGFLTSLRMAVLAAARDVTTPLADLFADASSVESTTTDGHRTSPRASTLSRWIDRTAVDLPDAVAISEAGSMTTHAELADAAARAAAGLVARGVRPGDVVGLRLTSLVDTATAMLAVMRVGAAFLPLDGELPPERLRHMVETAGCRLVVGEADLAEPAHVSVADLVAESAPVPIVDGTATYVMFTSGSSGRPKGVHMAHRALFNLTCWQIAALGITPGTRFLQYAPLGFDVSFQEVVPTLCAGGAVVSLGAVPRRDFPAVVRHVHREGVTHLYLPVAALRPFAQAALDADVELPLLTHLCVSGEQLVLDAEIRAFFDRHPGCVLVNLYGPTETHAVTTRVLRRPTASWPDHVPIGLPLTGVAAHVVDVTGHLAPPGVPGDLHLGGACPALGYINDEERTAVAFLPDRFGTGDTLYRTGDQVMRADGPELVFLGRADEQVKIRGYRVELGEVEAAARATGGVRHAVAAARDIGAGREIVLFAVADQDAVTRLPDALREALPPYAVPARVVRVDAIPTTANGKVDRARLLSEVPEPVGETAGSAPRDELEAGIAGVWAGLLGIATVHRDRSLLEYGVHSIMMFNGLRVINSRYGVELGIGDVFGATVADLARKVRDRTGGR